MRTTTLVVVIAVMAAVAGVLRFAEPDASAASVVTPDIPSALSVVQQQAPPVVTVRVGGSRDNIRIGDSVEPKGRAGRVQNPGLGRVPERPDHTMLTVEGQGVSMRDVGDSGEGNLIRIHVDADDEFTAVIGFYSTIAGDTPVNRPRTYSCKKCGGVLVCGIDPQCVN